MKVKQNHIGLEKSTIWSELYRKKDSGIFPDQKSGIGSLRLEVILKSWALLYNLAGHAISSGQRVRVECEIIGTLDKTTHTNRHTN